MKSSLVVIVLCAAAHAQTLLAPAYSSSRVDALARAIAKTEGFYAHGSKPARLHNPGDLKRNGKYIKFASDAAGFTALRGQLIKILNGQSRAYRLDMSIRQMARLYATSPLWPKNVTKILGVPENVSLRAYLCGGDVDVAPVLQFQL